MHSVETITGLRRFVAEWRRQDDTVAFVPTMGNLHDGHLELVRRARSAADRVVVSIYVNPLQFNDENDFTGYPRTPEADRDKLAAAQTDLLYLPEHNELYPFGLEDSVRVHVPGLSDILCGAFRPGHFDGVSTIVIKLFNAVQPDMALFGNKDYQQLLLIRRMTRDLCLPIDIIGVETVREQDGLAMSSRNHYLTAAQRRQAAVLYRQLEQVRAEVIRGRRDFDALQQQTMRELDRQGMQAEYCEIRRCEDLAVPEADDSELIVLAAAWLGPARLIDNLAI